MNHLEEWIRVMSTGLHAIAPEEAKLAVMWNHEAGELELPEHPGPGIPRYTAGYAGMIEQTRSGLLIPYLPAWGLAQGSILFEGYIIMENGWWRNAS